MINISQLLNALPKSATTLVEESFAELDSHVDPSRKARASSIGMTKFTGLSESDDGHARTNWLVNSASDAKVKYNCTVDIVVPKAGSLFALAKGKWEPAKFKDILTKSDVRVNCTCPDFYWSGMMHNNGESGRYKGSLASKATSVWNPQSDPQFPAVRNPSGDYTMCKHLHSVFKFFPTNAFDIMGKARKFNNTIQPSEEKTEKVNDNKVPVEKIKEPEDRKQGEPVTIPPEETKPILDSLYEAGEKLSQEVENNASEMIDNKNAETEVVNNTKPEEKALQPDLISDDTEEEYIPIVTDVNKVLNNPIDKTTPESSVDVNKIMGTKPAIETEKDIKKVSVTDIINPTMK